MRILDNNHYELGTGKRIYANKGILGISPLQEHIFDGFDGEFYFESETGGLASELTQSEAIEIADFMIVEWTRFRDHMAGTGKDIKTEWQKG